MLSTTCSSESSARLITMLRLQDQINSKINVAWTQAQNCWYRAIWTECAEMMDHVGWKWWKNQVPNVEQVHLELVDIFHFGLSELIVTSGSVHAASTSGGAAYQSIEVAPKDGIVEPELLLNSIEDFARSSLASKSFCMEMFSRLCISAGLVGDDLYRKYVGKNVLNTFRQDYGYKDGSYVKIWGGREDNEWLVEIGARVRASADEFPLELYRELEKAYQSHAALDGK
ncbi:dUTP diphosphatase [Stenotrophomonas indicatrix]|uniref:dUTP diphosphatase n=1 Tax=Stenotrophomonas indicatrix TaxID=2045451 RepID=UPI001C502106|nr:dUTP diphosphatase [Stenotrophomonas indicatrix]QXQ02280.1 dUTP diphosphatase [Stenotrophomonas indicatrix]